MDDTTLLQTESDGYPFIIVLSRGDGSRTVQTWELDLKRAKNRARSARMKKRSPALYQRTPTGAWEPVRF